MKTPSRSMLIAKATTGMTVLALLGALSVGGTRPAASAAHQHLQAPFSPASHLLSNIGSPGSFHPSTGPTETRGPRAVVHRAGQPEHPPATGGRATLFRTGHQGGEATLGVTRNGSIFFIGATMDEFPQIAMKVIRSGDRGHTWDVVWPTSADEKTKYAYAVDPYLYVDPSTDRVFATGLPIGCAPVTWSDDLGASWAADTPICGPQDHETLFAGPPVTSTTSGYPNVVYYCANLGTDVPWSNSCMKSLDGGKVFLPTGEAAFPSRPEDPLSCFGGHGHGVAGRDGTIYLPRVWCGGEPYVAISDDEGATWDQIQVADQHPSVGAAMENGPAPGLPPAPVHDAGVAVDPDGNIYVVWAGRNRLPYLSISGDDGRSWSKPVAVSPTGVNEAWQPQIDVGAPGEIAISYLATETSPGPPFDTSAYGDVTWDGFITRSRDALARHPRFSSARLNDPSDPLLRGACGPGRCQAQWDYQDVVIDADGVAWATFMDQCYEGTCDHVAGAGAVPYGEAVIGRF